MADEADDDGEPKIQLTKRSHVQQQLREHGLATLIPSSSKNRSKNRVKQLQKIGAGASRNTLGDTLKSAMTDT